MNEYMKGEEERFLEVAEGIVKVAVPGRFKKRVGNGSSERHFVG